MKHLSNKSFGLILMAYHSGQWSGVYSVASCLVAGTEIDKAQALRAMRELERVKLDAKFPEAVTRRLEKRCLILANEIQRRFLKE